MTGSLHNNNRGKDAPKRGVICNTETAPPAGAVRAKHTVHWFRKGLRLHDNPSLRDSLNGACTFRCVFVIDPWSAGSKSVGINKWR